MFRLGRTGEVKTGPGPREERMVGELEVLGYIGAGAQPRSHANRVGLSVRSSRGRIGGVHGKPGPSSRIEAAKRRSQRQPLDP